MDDAERKARGICVNCGHIGSLDELKAEHPKALSCCPERKAMSGSEALQYERIRALQEAAEVARNFEMFGHRTVHNELIATAISDLAKE